MQLHFFYTRKNKKNEYKSNLINLTLTSIV
jgi:hypothetical protein